MDKIDLVVSKIEDLKESIKKDFDNHRGHMEVKFDIYNDLLDIHIKRTNILEELHGDNTRRIEELEKPNEVNRYLYKALVKLSGGCAAIYGIYKLVELFI